MFGAVQPNRLQPVGSPQLYKTYQIVAPRSTHFRTATCSEVNCLNMARGWESLIDESTELGQKQAYYIRKQSGRSFKESRNEAGITAFIFTAGQTCFAQHQTRLDKPETFIVRNGDWRQSTVARTHVNAADWVDDFANHQDQIATQIERG